ncbi:MAG TPA: copper-containing nitrite reductase, partial [Terriglobales bacterium]|nr:copper-containing nitrite reductase [Terriglobales bacterium]
MALVEVRGKDMHTKNHSNIHIALSIATTLIFMLASLAAMAQSHDMSSMHMSGTHMSGHKSSAKVVDIVRDPSDVPTPVNGRPPAVVHVTLTAKEVVGQLDPASGTQYRYWTFNGKVPGPMIRVRQGDTVEVTLTNDPGSHMAHSVDLHAALGPGGGAAFSEAVPGQSKTFSFQATTPGLFVYHCGTPMIAEHIANGMYGLILVEPPDGLAHVDHEYYVMQGEMYTAKPKGTAGLQEFSGVKLMQENPEYFVFNGAVDALTSEHPLKADAGETVRIFFGDAGPNQPSSLHVVGEIFTKEYVAGSLTSAPENGVQTAMVAPGSAAILELKATTPGKFNFMDHAMSRMAKGLMGTIEVSG